MFEGCTSLTEAYELPAITAVNSCYRNMFKGCTGLTEPPKLPATTLTTYCYSNMFNKCSNIRISAEQGTFNGITYSVEYRIPSACTGTTADYALNNMFLATGGEFKETPDINTTYYLPAPAPAPATYTVTWKNYNGSVLETDENVAESATPTYDGEAPVKPEDANGIYTFEAWDDGKYNEEVNRKDGNHPTNAKGWYKATVNFVAAHMAHKISATVYLNGEMLYEIDTYSVQDYAEEVYANPEKYDTMGKPNQLKALAAAMLHYGSEAQTVFADALQVQPDCADSNLDAAADCSGVDADAVAAAINGSSSDLNAVAAQLGAKYFTNSLIYLSKNTLRIYFTPTSYPGEIPNADAYDGNLSSYYYYVDHADINAAELDNQQTFNIAGTEFTFSALDYVVAVIGSNSMTDTQKKLAKSPLLQITTRSRG